MISNVRDAFFAGSLLDASGCPVGNRRYPRNRQADRNKDRSVSADRELQMSSNYSRETLLFAHNSPYLMLTRAAHHLWALRAGKSIQVDEKAILEAACQTLWAAKRQVRQEVEAIVKQRAKEYFA